MKSREPEARGTFKKYADSDGASSGRGWVAQTVLVAVPMLSETVIETVESGFTSTRA